MLKYGTKGIYESVSKMSWKVLNGSWVSCMSHKSLLSYRRSFLFSLVHVSQIVQDLIEMIENKHKEKY